MTALAEMEDPNLCASACVDVSALFPCDCVRLKVKGAFPCTHTSHLFGLLNYGRGGKKIKKLLRVIKPSQSNSHRLTESGSKRPREAKVCSGHGARAHFVILVGFIRKGEMKQTDGKGGLYLN